MSQESVREDNTEEPQLTVDARPLQEPLAVVVNKARPDLQVHQDSLAKTASLVLLGYLEEMEEQASTSSQSALVKHLVRRFEFDIVRKWR